MNLIRIKEDDNWAIDYDREHGMYRVSYFEDGHFVNEYWFDAYDNKEIIVMTNLIDYLERVKQSGQKMLGNTKYLKKSQFGKFMDTLIDKIKNL